MPFVRSSSDGAKRVPRGWVGPGIMRLDRRLGATRPMIVRGAALLAGGGRHRLPPRPAGDRRGAGCVAARRPLASCPGPRRRLRAPGPVAGGLGGVVRDGSDRSRLRRGHRRDDGVQHGSTARRVPDARGRPQPRRADRCERHVGRRGGRGSAGRTAPRGRPDRRWRSPCRPRRVRRRPRRVGDRRGASSPPSRSSPPPREATTPGPSGRSWPT